MPNINGRYVPYWHYDAVQARAIADAKAAEGEPEEVKPARKTKVKVERAVIEPEAETADITLSTE